ncbi:MAG: methylenetetrahydrofolate--tRNA-(uracil(54)-C(5))-methyltransferase (FADH(2)-oxidizing) TrmFO [Synergistaceae bacterium]
MISKEKVTIIGGGLAGAEAAWQLAKRGIHVTLYEMRPNVMTPAHQTKHIAEMVCSNSLGGESTTTTSGILKRELLMMDSLLIKCALKAKVPAGNALAVDRECFSSEIESCLNNNPLIEIVREEVTRIPDGNVIIATGPLTSGSFSTTLKDIVGEDFLYFYDAVAPIVTLESIDTSCSFRGNRYGDNDDYINCPMNEEEYNIFWRELVNAECAPRHEFEEMKHFDGCLPVEVIAKRGEKTLLFGPLRPVGLSVDEENTNYHAVVQLRQDNTDGTLYNIVGFQTNLKWGEQERVFRLIPALKNAEFVRKGVMHRNLFVCAPKVLDRYLRIRNHANVYLAGQITGVEGYVESIAMGFASAIFMYCNITRNGTIEFPIESAIGSLLNYLGDALPKSFQPMNINLGIFPRLQGRKIYKRKERCQAYAERSFLSIEKFLSENPMIFDSFEKFEKLV